MVLVSTPVNVHIGSGKDSRMTWEAFKKLVEDDRGWKYDSDNKCFYYYVRGKIRNVKSYLVLFLAAYHGCYDNLSEYIV